ncbi:hypothetical protein J2Y69_003365 [Microbacterium resistens]|uniref:Uncharacterized protein n=1 Tax=Microbacterium resistens TaxID=156977 RepID=A0ABU1SGK6_9MICO|nr:hypothetical protein [Microbacterium resistens]MDR6868741.1 hypothetical protein [Microbacterium resistens]
MNATTEDRAPITTGIYHDRDGDIWAVLQDQCAVGLADHAAGPPTSGEFVAMAFRPVPVDALSEDFGPLTPIHLFPEASA